MNKKLIFFVNIPIAPRKVTRTCTNHPISNHVSYKKLSPCFSGFISQLSNVNVTKDIQEALNVPEWREAVLKEMKALEKNDTWEKVNLLEERH